ncbi:hypothetical protein HK098_002817 [Nowakowskiella sp. JEL0407]|nr:hypothetical protein HK098_002817 [Nowakowskiella sp. JEL0407]
MSEKENQITVVGEVEADRKELLPAEDKPVDEKKDEDGLDTLEEGVLLEEEFKAPKLPLWTLFKIFFNFGLNAWGGPVAQIALIKEQLVDQEKWISKQTFSRVYAVYQILPGPEAAELCCYFAHLSRGKIGALLGGLGFILPGWVLMTVGSLLYDVIKENMYFLASFKALQPIVAAMVLRAVHKLGDHALVNPKTNKLDYLLFWLALLAAFNSVLHINIFITLFVFGIVTTLFRRNYKILSYLVIVLLYVGVGIYIHFKGLPSEAALGVGVAPGPVPGFGNLFALGLLGGLLSFGGAYTSIPFVLQEASVIGGWISQKVFLDGVALANALPAPTVIFSTFVGAVGGGVGRAGPAQVWWSLLGSLLTTIGMFIPCFSFTIIGHKLWDAIVHYPLVEDFLEGITGSVIGFILITAFTLLKGSLESAAVPIKRDDGTSTPGTSDVAIAAVLYVVGIYVLYNFKHKLTSVVLVLVAAIAGQFLYR